MAKNNLDQIDTQPRTGNEMFQAIGADTNIANGGHKMSTLQRKGCYNGYIFSTGVQQYSTGYFALSE